MNAPTADCFKNIDGFVEATSYERMMLWDDWKEIVEWNDELEGRFMEIGKYNDMPVCLSFSFTKVGDKRICFYEATSMIVNYDLVNRWFDKFFEGVCRTDAMNFHNVL